VHSVRYLLPAAFWRFPVHSPASSVAYTRFSCSENFDLLPFCSVMTVLRSANSFISAFRDFDFAMPVLPGAPATVFA